MSSSALQPVGTSDQHPADKSLTYEWILLAESWQVFVVIVGAIFLGVLITSWVELEDLPIAISVGINYISEILLAGWFYAVGRNLYRIRPSGVRLRFGLFVANLIFFLLYSIVLLIFATAILDPTVLPVTAASLWLLLPFHLYAIASACQIVAFVARALAVAEAHAEVPFGFYGGTFLMLFFFPFGIWIIQPRLQTIFRDQIEHEDDLAGDLVDL